MTEDADTPELAVGQQWYARLPGVAGLAEIQIIALSKRTVQVMHLPHSHLQPRYETETVCFIEPIEQETT